MLNQKIKVRTYVKGNIEKRACQICMCNTVCDMNPKCRRSGCRNSIRQDSSKPCSHKLKHFPCGWMKEYDGMEAGLLDRMC